MEPDSFLEYYISEDTETRNEDGIDTELIVSGIRSFRKIIIYTGIGAK